MEEAVEAAGGLLLLLLLYCVHRYFYEYRIGQRALVITWLGIPVRRIPYTDIESVSKRREGKAENWSSTWRHRHRILVIRRRGGWYREILVTPLYRYEFRCRLESAMARAAGDQSSPI